VLKTKKICQKVVFSVVSLIFILSPVIVGNFSFALGQNQVIDILTVNDYHGRIVGDYGGSKPTNDATWLYADKVESLKQQNPDGTIFASGGDNISASLFTSSIEQDDPTIDMFNSLNLDVSVVGNHEFDKGLSDLQNRVFARAQFPYLADNVYKKGTKQPYFPPENLYKVVEKKGIRVGFVGSVTQETPAMINPAYIKDIDFGDPVEAVNKQAEYLKTNNLADVIIALYHEGANCSDNPADKESYCSSIDDAKTHFPVFGNIVDNTSSDVSAIVMGHTHKKYVWQDVAHNNRTVTQTGCYGAAVGDIKLNVDTDTKTVVSSSAEVDSKYQFAKPIDSSQYNTYRHASISAYSGVLDVADIADQAQAYADQVGLTPLTGAKTNITRALNGCEYIKDIYSCDLSQISENRAEESSVGRLVATAYRKYVADQLARKIDLAAINPGGLRTDIIPDANGKITYGNVVSLQPFANELFICHFTGQQLKQLVEEQWQVNSEGQRPSTPFLALSFSDGLTYTVDTLDPLANPGNHVINMTLNGEQIEQNKVYTVATINFLVNGGDNFSIFTQTKADDAGFVDFDALSEYLKSQGLNYEFAPSFKRSSTVINHKLPVNLRVGDNLNQTVSHINMLSDKAPENKFMEVYLASNKIASVPILKDKLNNDKIGKTNSVQASDNYNDEAFGYANIHVVVPNNMSTGDYNVKYVAEPSGTTIFQRIHIIGNSNLYPDTGTPIMSLLFIMILLSTTGFIVKSYVEK
jgi:5'-nucleotidase